MAPESVRTGGEPADGLRQRRHRKGVDRRSASHPPRTPAELGRRDRRPRRARGRAVVRRLRSRVDGDHRRPGGGGHLRPPRPRQAAEQLLRTLRRQRRRPRREPHLHLLRAPAGRGPDQQLVRPAGDARHAHRPVRRRHARPHDVRRAVLHGPAELAQLGHRGGDHRQPLRRRLDADHDPHGPSRTRPAGRGRRVRARRPHRRRAFEAGAGRRRLAMQRHQVHRPLPGEPRDLELRLRLRRQCAPGQEVFRPCASPA